MSECKNKHCIEGIEFITCCSGRDCGCYGKPVAARFCPECNGERREPKDKETLEMLEYVEWLDV